MADLGDLSDFMGPSKSVSNLDWLDVNEEEYRAEAPLPKQNLDIAPDLIAMWRHQDEPASNFVPNTGAPKTMLDVGSAGPVLSIPEDLRRTARLAIMQTTDPQKIGHVLSSRYDGTTLQNAKTALAEVFAERGLLGRFYVAAADFNDCNRGSKTASEFVRRYAQGAQYVLAKSACNDCRYRQVAGNSSNHCGVFHKQIVPEIPYTDGLATNVEQRQASLGRPVTASTGTPRERIQRAFLAESATQVAAFTGQHQYSPPVQKVDSGEVLIAASNLMKKRDAEAQQKMAAIQARPIVAMLRREMLKGRNRTELSHALRLAFDVRELEATKSEWSPIFREAGLYGSLYTTQASFDDCREGADFINKHGSKVRAVVAGDKCGGCIFNKVGRCMMYGRKLIASAEELYTPETVAAVLDEHRMAGNLPYEAARMHWGSTPVEALKALHEAATAPLAGGPTASLRSNVEKAFYGAGRQAQTGDLTKREVVKYASRYMNEGLYGTDLLEALKSRFSASDLSATRAELKVVLAEQGLQGIRFVDPTIYDDYGKGCHEASRLHRSRSAVQYLKVGGKCASCVHQTRPGFCSTINKQLVVEPPYIDKAAEQRAIMASGVSTHVSYEGLMNNGLSMMQEYQIQHDPMSLSLNPEVKGLEASIQFGGQEVKL